MNMGLNWAIISVDSEPLLRASRRSFAPHAQTIRMGDIVFLIFEDTIRGIVTTQARERGFNLEDSDVGSAEGEFYLVIQKGRIFQIEHPDSRVLVDKGRYLIVDLSAQEAGRIETGLEPCYSVEPLTESRTAFDIRSRPAARAAPLAWIQILVDSVTRQNYEPPLTYLASFPTRFSTSSHFLDAATWCKDQLSAMGYAASDQSLPLGGGTTRNVIAEKTGSGTADRSLVLVLAHLDSINISGGADSTAPGADDNGSGSAGIIELARVFKNHQAEHDIRFVLFGGEEQGLVGSNYYLDHLPAADRNRINVIINMDMIGSLNTAQPTVLLESSAMFQGIIDDLAHAADTYTTLTVQTSVNPFASDHVPFINAGLPAVLTIEGADGANENIHTENDTMAQINYDLALEILKMNVAEIATKLGQKKEYTMSDFIIPKWEYEKLNFDFPVKLISRQVSGRYIYNNGVSAREVREASENFGQGRNNKFLDTKYMLDKPTYINPNSILYKFNYKPYIFKVLKVVRFTLHIDIDGTDPLDVVSGTVRLLLRESAGTRSNAFHHLDLFRDRRVLEQKTQYPPAGKPHPIGPDVQRRERIAHRRDDLHIRNLGCDTDRIKIKLREFTESPRTGFVLAPDRRNLISTEWPGQVAVLRDHPRQRNGQVEAKPERFIGVAKTHVGILDRENRILCLRARRT
ncbi:MAG: Zn-dependent exopeptidase M28 [SAR324 cluster bacterium]|nr:Zn-dependent exopeptidase M28 [SAR324 cluster bacterium]